MWAKAALCAVLATTSLAACNKVTYKNPALTPTGATHSETGWFFLDGLIGTKEIYANRVCPEGVAQVKSRFSFGNLFIATITGGLVTPRKYTIWCGR